MLDNDTLIAATPLLDFNAASVAQLIDERGWRDLPARGRIGAIYVFVRDEIAFGYNRADDIPASEVFADGFGQCNTKGTLLMALLRGAGIRCRIHGFTIHKALQRGVVPELVYPITPKEILHSWVEVELDGTWINLEGFILDTPFLRVLQTSFASDESLCGYGVGTECLSAPPVAWNGSDTFIQTSGIVQDLGRFDTPDMFYAAHDQAFGHIRGWLYRNLIRHWMNARVRALRSGRLKPRKSITHKHEGPANAA